MPFSLTIAALAQPDGGWEKMHVDWPGAPLMSTDSELRSSRNAVRRSVAIRGSGNANVIYFRMVAGSKSYILNPAILVHHDGWPRLPEPRQV